MNNTLVAWAVAWGVSGAAVADLLDRLHADVQPVAEIAAAADQSEAETTGDVLTRAAELGMRVFRNNSGGFEDARGRFIRFGLGNISKRVNTQYKSSDYIGFTPYVVTPWDIGRSLPVFTSLEIKHSGWVFSDKNPDWVAQRNWLEMVELHGGIGRFATGRNFM